MKFNAFILIVSTLVCTIEARKYVASDFAISRNCTEIFTVNTPKYVPYEEVYYTRTWLGFKKRKTRMNYRLENHVSEHTRRVCCSGYQTYGSNLCLPACSRGCSANGICAAPEVCRCNEGYRMERALNECKPICLNECVNGFCISPNLCACNDGYRMRPDGFTCEPICHECSNLEYCVEPHVCRCINGYTRDALERIDRATSGAECRPVCERECVNADCVEPDRCECRAGYADFDDDAFTCEPVCRYACTMGTCSAPNTCSCLPGHAPRANHSNICDPVCRGGCVNAECIAPDICSCYDGYFTDGPDTSGTCKPFCSNSCQHGSCTAPEECTCDDGYSWNRTAKLCEPICSETCSNGNCTAPETCACFDGYRVSQESTYTCEPICEEACINGHCTAPNECTCEDGYEKRNNVSGSKCIVACECENGYCSEESSGCQSCEEGYDLTPSHNSSALVSCRPHCDGGCAHGQCVEPQKCECDEYYLAENDTSSGDPVLCVHACGGDCLHGSCLIDRRLCECPYGWAGKLCEQPTACAVLVAVGDPLYAMLNESRGYGEFENASAIENPWTGPNCTDECRQTIDNSTLCSEELGELHSTCLIDINSPCNSYKVVMFDTYRSQVNMITIVMSAVISILCVAALIFTVLFVRNRNRNRVFELSRSPNQVIKHEDACLIENEADSISL